ncbi:3-isopropylmalate dehydratase small subunit [Buchnera aphidicola]|uniref:3-isopropylmalate dehydratase small subunit n=1 Tax=Buchnera aphidicola (Stegophylla sp.) TaxID=2315800 RepID=A0A4D6YNC7_9GAMM|nr:3-isopropylmalate dehydratase small subunit [Buchnera aphidicola (Stegophylla sp.)]
MKPFTNHTGIIAPLDISNIDTDAIIPKQFLQKVSKTGFKKYLFYNWKFINGDIKKINHTFILNHPNYKKSSILITRHNFGCGSSREHAVWALLDYGFKAIIAPSFADIFYSNSFNNHLLLITLSENYINNIFYIIYNKPGIQATINLQNNQFILCNKIYSFKINNFHRLCLLKGLDNIDLTMKYEKYILQYEKNIPNFLKYN